MNFSEALTEIKAGKKVRRAAWDEGGVLRGLTIELVQVVSANDGRPVMPLLLGQGRDGVLRSFAVAQWDLLADDWEVVDGGS